MQHDGGPRQQRTPDEHGFLEQVLADRPWLQVWLHVDPEGTAWACVSYDITGDQGILKTLRLDFDGAEINGGWSPSCLNWDDGVRAGDAGVDVTGADGISLAGEVPQLAAAAGRWFDRHRAH